MVPRDLRELIPIGGTLALLTLAQSVAECVDEYLASWVAERFLRDLRTAVFSHLHRLSPSFFEGRRLGDVVARLIGDVATIETLMLSGVADGLTYALWIVLFGTALFILAWQLALAALVVAPLFWLITRHLSGEIKGLRGRSADPAAPSARSPRRAWVTPRSFRPTRGRAARSTGSPSRATEPSRLKWNRHVCEGCSRC